MPTRRQQSMVKNYLSICALAVLISSSVFGAPPRPATDRIDAVVGQPIILRLRVDDQIQIRDGLRVQLDDARVIETLVFWVEYLPPLHSAGWTTPPIGIHAVRMRTAMMIDRDDRLVGSWFAQISIPLDAVGQGLWIEGERYELNWLPDPERAMLEAQGRDIESFFVPAHRQPVLNAPPVQSAITQLAQSPLTRWRARLLLDGLSTSARFIAPDAPRAEGYLSDLHDDISSTESENFLEALAVQNEIRWQIILGRIWLIDPDLAERLKVALTRVVLFDGHPLPMWVSSQSKTDKLAHDLLSPWVDDELRANRARAWLDALPRALVWVVDDLGHLEPETSRFSPTLAFVSLPPEPGDSLVRLDAPRSRSVLETINDQAVHTLQISTPKHETPPEQTIVPTHQIRIRIGHAEITRRGIAAPIPASPPGIRVGPLKGDWTMDGLMNPNPNAQSAMPIIRSTVGILHRTAPPNEPDPRVGWTLFLECATQSPTNPDDQITLWVGAYENPLAAWTINADGTTELVGGSIPTIADLGVRVFALDDRWTAQIELPKQSIGDDLILSIGIERSDADGYHSAWPRKMTPGQHEPGRLLVDISTWDGFRASPMNQRNQRNQLNPQP
ncbi:MAG: hypothetical protein JKY96_01365 [Phycisphaerales bacterium]|nr:hypothetical protein [Phycisphaerales bacterium]